MHDSSGLFILTLFMVAVGNVGLGFKPKKRTASWFKTRTHHSQFLRYAFSFDAKVTVIPSRHNKLIQRLEAVERSRSVTQPLENVC